MAKKDSEDQRPDEVVIPDDLTTLTNDELGELREQATAAFNDLYGEDGKGLNPEQVAALGQLADGIDVLKAEQGVRSERAAELEAQAAELANRVAGPEDSDTETGEDDEVGTVEEGTDSEDASSEDEAAAETVVAEAETVVAEAVDAEAVVASSGPKRIALPGLANRRRTRAAKKEADTNANSNVATMYSSTEGYGLVNGQTVDWGQVSKALDQKVRRFNTAAFEAARKSGKRLRQESALLTVNKPFPAELTVKDGASTEDVERALTFATDQARLPGGSLLQSQALTASGGWCAPSETIYDLCELESRDGMLSIPEISLSRGGLRHALGPDFAFLYANTGFCYTEDEDIAGDYDGEGGGTKPCFHVECPDFTDDRMGYCGVCITAGLLQSRGYPEAIARTLRGAVIAHEHRVNTNVISQIVAGSTAVTLPTTQAGATAPILTAIELQAEHIKHVNRMSRSTVLEAVFPYWVRGVIRSDLSRRLGVDMLSVTDQMIMGWFRERGIAPQFVYDWQDIATTAASAFTSWPTTVSFLLYPAGTWVKGTSAIIDLGTIYDSNLLGTNDYTALFTEEGYLVAKRCHDSRVVTTDICPDGATAAGISIECDGTVGA